MTQDLDKTIEDLEKEVVSELEEKAHDAPMKSAGKPDPMPKMKGAETPEDLGGATPDKPVAKSPDSAKKVKQNTSDPAMKGAVKAEGYSDEEIRKLCHSKDHDCATVVEHPIWGKGKPIHGSHAIPDDKGYVEWYDVQFKHGLEEKVMAEDMKVMVSEAHHEEKEPEKMTKMELKAAMDKKLMKMGKHDLVATYKAMEGGHEPTEEQLELEGLSKAKEAIEKRLASINVQEDVDALVEGEELSEDFKKKAVTIFEAAVKSKIRPEVERIELEKTQEVAEDMEAFKSELAEKVDGYLDYVVKEWMTENELAIERGLKGEIAEDFITGLKALFEEHYIDVPDLSLIHISEPTRPY